MNNSNIYTFENFVNKINDGYIVTYDINKTVSDLDRRLKLFNISYDLSTVDNRKIELKINELDKIKNTEFIIDSILSELFNLYGWFAATMEIQNFFGKIRNFKFNKDFLLNPDNNIISASIIFESKYDLIEINIPNKLYHLSIQEYENSILKNGILPKSKSKLSNHDYDGRIYLCRTISHCKSLIPKMSLFYSDEKNSILYSGKNPEKKYNKNTKWIIFEIDTKEAKIEKIYSDPNYLSGVYYLGTINPKSITYIEREL